MAQPTRIEDDAKLMARIALGDSEAERELISQYFPKMYGLACRMLIDKNEAEDVCQETFIRLWRVADTWVASAKVSTWLYRVIYNLCVDQLRKNKHFIDDGPGYLEEMADHAKSPMDDYQSSQVAEHVNAEIHNLPLRQRTAITLVYHNEMRNTEAAEVMGITIDALESLLARGRQRLKDRLFEIRHDLF
jgi:RNA polymerase sigma-70 factor, ECF subfamily